MPQKKIISTPNFRFIFYNELELLLKSYIKRKIKEEISGGLIGDIAGGKQNEIIFQIKHFLPFPNLAKDKRHHAQPPEIWFEILEEWRLFYFADLKFIGFLHTHPEGTSKMSKQDVLYGKHLQKQYGSIIFMIVSENRALRSYLFNENLIKLIDGESDYFKILKN